MITIIFSNREDEDCRLIKSILDRIPGEVINEYIEIRYDDEITDDLTDDIEYAISSEDDTIIIIGHGTEEGLLSPAYTEYLIWDEHMEKIHARRTICFWCYASAFVETLRYHPDIMATGMFISNEYEAGNEGITISQPEIDRANYFIYEQLINLMVSTNSFTEWDSVMHNTVVHNAVDEFNRSGITFFNKKESC